MQLRLNPAHPLCQPSRNLVFASFGTGHGGQVLDLSDRPSHGVILDNHAVPIVSRSLQSVRPPGFPADFNPLTFRNTDTVSACVQFGNVTKVTSLTDNFTVAMWTRPFDLSSGYQIALNTSSTGYPRGWNIQPTNLGDGSLFPVNAWGVQFIETNGVESPRVANLPQLALAQWHLLCFSCSFPTVSLYTNGQGTPIAYAPSSGGFASGQNLTFGGLDGGPTYPARSDIGPVLIWGSVLSADDIALLYRDTWGMVTRGTPLALRVAASAPAAQAGGGIRRRIPFAGRFRPGMFRSLGGL
jgi:hypothetical protein